MKNINTYKHEGNSFESLKKQRIEYLNLVIKSLENKKYSDDDVDFVIYGRKEAGGYVKERERLRAIAELKEYVKYINSIEVIGNEGFEELASKIYILTNKQTETIKILKTYPHIRVKRSNVENEDGYKEYIHDENGYKIDDTILFDIILQESLKGSELGRIAEEMRWRNCYKRNGIHTWRSSKFVDVLYEYTDYML